MTRQLESHYDCIVMGGGPAGSTVAALVAEAGFATLLLERDRMPRPHVGESLMPESYWVFERLGVLDKLAASPFVRKVGVQFVTNQGKESQPFLFRQHDARPSSETWHVDRAGFDHLLFEHAAEKGAQCCDKTRVLDVSFEGERATGIVVQSENSVANDGPQRIAARVVVDATGQQTLLASKLSIRRVDPQLKKVAIWGHYRGGARDTSGGGVKTIILHTRDKKSWFWYIPLANDLVSVGVVGDRDYLLKGRGTPAQTFAEELELCPGVAERLAEAEQDSELAVLKEFSYTTDRAAGDGWVLVGDAWGFIDPVYSSGVYLAVKSGELAADCIAAGLAKDDVSAEQLGRWAPAFAADTGWIRKLVHAFYSNQFRVGQFVKEHPEHQGNLVDLLIGRIFQPDAGRIFEDLDPWLERAASESGG